MTSATSPSLRPPIDPRLRDRRVAVQRHEGRRRLYVLLAVLAVPVVAALGFASTRSRLLDLDHVEIRGAIRTPRAAVAPAGGLARGQALTSIDTGRVERRVERLPWVLEARAERRWPGTVAVEVVERQARAVVPVGGGARWASVDATGRVLSVETAKPAGLPAIGGLGDPGAPGTVLVPAALPALRIAVALAPSLRARVGDVASAPGGDVELQLVPSGVLVRLGDSEQLELKLRALRTFLAATPLDDVAVVDLRVPSAPVLTRR